MAAPEVRNGDFVFRDALFAEISDGKRHPRAAPSDLKDLLLPKKGTPAAKDQVAHWYEAQLIHYGLARSKDKNTAKVRLTAALSTDGLKVPPNIQNIETELKKEYAAGVRKLKAAEKKAQLPAAEAAPKNKKRKAGDDVSKITVKADGVELTIDRKAGAVSESATKRKKAEPMTPSKATAKPKPAGKPAPTNGTKTATPSLPKSKPVTGPTARIFATKQTARRAKPSHYPSTSSRPVPHSPQQYADDTPANYHDSDVEMNDAPPPYESIDFNHRSETAPVQISGTYIIETEQTNENLVLRIDRAKQQLWGPFSVAAIKGVLFMDEIDGLTVGDRKQFTWRAEDTYLAQYLFRRDQTGWLEFDGQGAVSGCFYGLMSGDDVSFEGQLATDDAPEVQKIRFEWEAIPRRAYSRSKN